MGIYQLNEFTKIENFPAPKEFVSGERLPYIRRSYRLQVVKTDTKHSELHFDRGKFIATTPNNNKKHFTKIKQESVKWYHKKVLAKLNERIDLHYFLVVCSLIFSITAFLRKIHSFKRGSMCISSEVVCIYFNC